MKPVEAKSCDSVACPMLVYGRCGVGNKPETCDIARSIRQPTAYELEEVPV